MSIKLGLIGGSLGVVDDDRCMAEARLGDETLRGRNDGDAVLEPGIGRIVVCVILWEYSGGFSAELKEVELWKVVIPEVVLTMWLRVDVTELKAGSESLSGPEGVGENIDL
ncbi:hypothetical protein BLNAU_15420 [Blattamonas nauphoetae]|uniref:Uncharacterized protein n=1 Tax=Blattamonas nauphoetae TaxID=2049346 RepID=A0ABQ9XD99_9EUKA|nr:hypothetical protein BLNAU_15420 [Blattamonas nauphoetae]